MKKRSVLIVLCVFVLTLNVNSVASVVNINEIEVNPTGNDSGNEWIELYNDGPPINLNNWYLQNKEWLKNVTSGEYKQYFELQYHRR